MTISKYGFVEKKILKNATDYNMEKVKKMVKYKTY